jgi:hypothetical protein
MVGGSLRRLARYGAAAGLAAAAVVARFAVYRLTNIELPFLTFLPAILAAALWFGLGPGLACTLLSTVAAGWCLLPRGFRHRPRCRQSARAAALRHERGPRLRAGREQPPESRAQARDRAPPGRDRVSPRRARAGSQRANIAAYLLLDALGVGAW